MNGYLITTIVLIVLAVILAIVGIVFDFVAARQRKSGYALASGIITIVSILFFIGGAVAGYIYSKRKVSALKDRLVSGAESIIGEENLDRVKRTVSDLEENVQTAGGRVLRRRDGLGDLAARGASKVVEKTGRGTRAADFLGNKSEYFNRVGTTAINKLNRSANAV